LAQLTGTLHLTGFIAHGQATGTLTFTVGGDRLSLSLVGPVQPGFSGAPKSFTYTITGGTGHFAGDRGGGMVNLQETPAALDSNGSLPFLPAPGPSGIFTMTFRPGR
jgi:hypothetical protein